MKYLAIIVLVLITSTAHASKDRAYFVCAPWNSDSDPAVHTTSLIAAGPTKEFRAYIDMGANLLKRRPDYVVAKNSKKNMEHNWYWGGDDNRSYTLRMTELKRGLVVGQYWDFSVSAEVKQPDMEWECARRHGKK